MIEDPLKEAYWKLHQCRESIRDLGATMAGAGKYGAYSAAFSAVNAAMEAIPDEDPVNEIEQAARQLYAARTKREAARKALYFYRLKNGNCHVIEAKLDDTPCYSKKLWSKQWCDACQNSQPLHEAKIAAANEVGAAMRRLMRLCGG